MDSNDIILIVLYVFFLLISLLIRKMMIKIKRGWLFAFVPVYLASVFLYLTIVYNGVSYLNNNFGTNIYFGHADTGLVLLFLIVLSTAAITIVTIIIGINKEIFLKGKI